MLDWCDYNASGTLFWTTGYDGSAWILLARRREMTLLGNAYSFSVPVSLVKDGEDSRDCAARAAHDELGLMVSSNTLEEFWHQDYANIHVTLYAKRLSSMAKPKFLSHYHDGGWILLPDDSRVEDGDLLLRDELDAFRVYLDLQRKAG